LKLINISRVLIKTAPLGATNKNIRKKSTFYLIILLTFLIKQSVLGQTSDSIQKVKILSESSQEKRVNRYLDLKNQRDLIDIGYFIIKKNPDLRLDSSKKKTVRLHISGSPTPEYSLATGFAANITGNIAFYSGHNRDNNISAILFSPTYTEKKQIIAPIQSSIWTKGNKYNFLGDWRFLKYPEDTYGLGGYTTAKDATQLDYDYIRLYQFVLRKIRDNLFAGLGYQFDNHWNIKELNIPVGVVTDFDKYGFNDNSVSSGISLDLLIDTRKNSINPEGGFYGNLVFRQNLAVLGSDRNWESMLIDLRKYFHLPGSSKNILAFWSYNWLTLRGNPPYMDLPSTGWDTYSNTGRGYVQSRFRSKDMVDLEAEYRFAIMNNGLLSGVIFGNAQTYSEINNNRLEVIEPAVGLGLRIKFNKFSRTNICIDYAVGKNGSNGIFTNLGEVF
jgi:hypothetical protein